MRVTGTAAAVVATLATLGVATAVAAAGAHSHRRVRARLSATAGGGAAPGAGRVPVLTVTATVAGLLTAWATSGPRAVVVLLAVSTGLVAQAALRRRLARRRSRLTQLPTALDRLAAALRTGTSLPAALGEVGAGLDPPIGPELVALGRQAAHGQPVCDVLDGWASVHDDAGTRLAASALVLATVIGSAPARAVDGVAATVRERLDLAAERRALAAQARASGLVLSLAPLAFAGVLVLADTAAARFLLGTPGGWACLTVGIGLDAAGAWWMSRLTRTDER